MNDLDLHDDDEFFTEFWSFAKKWFALVVLVILAVIVFIMGVIALLFDHFGVIALAVLFL